MFALPRCSGCPKPPHHQAQIQQRQAVLWGPRTEQQFYPEVIIFWLKLWISFSCAWWASGHFLNSPPKLSVFYMKRPYVIINIRLRSGSHSKCQPTKLPLKIKSLPSSKGRLKGGKEKSQIQRTVQIKWSLLLTKHILQKHTWCFSGGAALDKMWVSFKKDIISNEFWKCHTEYWSIKSCRQRDRGRQRALPVIQFSELADTSSPRQMASANGRGREVAGARQGLCCHSELCCSEHCWPKQCGQVAVAWLCAHIMPVCL